MHDKIDPRVCTLSYVTVDDVARAIEVAGVRVMLAKVDIKCAYCMISIQLEDRPSWMWYRR